MKRILLKLSGEALAGEKHTGFDEPTVTVVAKQVKQLVDQGTEVGIVIGGGNFWRGRTSETIDRTKADQIGMLATVMNCIYVSEIFRSVGLMTQILTPANILIRELFVSLQAVQGILIFPQIQQQFCAQLRWRQTVFCWQKRLMAFMTAIPSPTLLQ